MTNRRPSSIETPDWSTIPAPIDDGATSHLVGERMPHLALPATDGTFVELSTLAGRVVIYAYPRTGRPGEPNPEGWDLVPGARGCTPQSCSFKDHFTELKDRGVNQLFGLSTQTTSYQREVIDRLHLPFPILSDEHFALAEALRLPTFEISGLKLLKRFTLVVDNGIITHVFYPVFPPDTNATDVLAWLETAPPPAPQ